MKPGDWRFASASVTGTSHLKGDGDCQDSHECDVITSLSGESVLVAIVSDGAGSAKFAARGSKAACKTVLEEARNWFATNRELDGITQELTSDWLRSFQNEIRQLADSEGAAVRDFACTMIVAIVGFEKAVFIQVGDGAIVVKGQDAEEYDWVFWPERGEYENTTFFATQDDADSHLQYELVQRRIDELAVFSDGLQRLALDLKGNQVHTPLFRSLFRPLLGIAAGRSRELSGSLTEFLGSSRVNERTDDDKTLILATRVIPTDTSSISS